MPVAIDQIQTVAQFEAASLPGSTLTFDIPGYYSLGVGGLTVRRVNIEPSHPWKFRSLDRFIVNGSIDNTNGGWWEGYPDGQDFVDVLQFGAVADGVTDDLAKFNNAIAYLNAHYQSLSFYVCDYSLYIPAGKYFLSATWDIGLRGKHIFGDPPTLLSTIKTQLFFPEDTVGLLASNSSGFGSIRLDNFTVTANRAGKMFNNLMHGIQCHVPVIANYVTVQNFNGNGWHLVGSTDGANPWGQFGLVDLSCLTGCAGDNCGANGFYCFGADANVMYFLQCSALGNVMYGFRDDGFLGNAYQSCHTSSNGRGLEAAKSDIGSMVNHAGKAYTPVPVYENFNLTLPSTTTPGTDDTVWRCILDTTVANFPTWTNGVNYQAGGSYCSTGLTRFFACYAEDGQGVAWSGGPRWSNVFLSAWGPGLPAAESKYSLEPCIEIVNPLKPGTTTMEDITLKFCRQINGAAGNNQIMTIIGSVSGEFDLQLNKTDGNLEWTPTGAAVIPMRITGNATTFDFQTGVSIVGVLCAEKLGFNNTIILDAGTGAPSGGSGARGWRRFADQPRTYGPNGWIKLTKVATPTWIAQYLNAAPSYPADTLSNISAQWHDGLTAGARAFVTDATVAAAGNFGAVITGGGANFVPAYFDGTNWRIG